MKLHLTQAGERALKEIMEIIREVNPLINTKHWSLLNEQILLAYRKSLKARKARQLADAMLPPEAKRRVLIEELSKLSDSADGNLLKTLEKSVEKMRSQTQKEVKNET